MKGKKAQKVQQPVITEEDKQNDPFIRAIAKKIRNINKKISDIEALEKRDDLKPEQQEKINSKQTLLDQRKKFEDFVKFYKSTLVEAANEKEAKQASPIIGKLSRSLILAHWLGSGVEAKQLGLSGNQRKLLTNLANVGKQESALSDLANQLSGYFNEYLDNEKLVGKVDELFSNQATGSRRVNLYSKPEPEITHHTPKKEQKEVHKQVHKQAHKQSQKQVQKSAQKSVKESAPVEKVQTLVQPTPAVSADHVAEEKPVISEQAPVTTETTQQPKQEQVKQEQPNATENPPTPVEGETKPRQQGVQRDKPYKPHTKRPYRPRQGEEGYREGGNRQRGGYKPKYSEKRDREEQNSDEEPEGEQEENARTTFNNKQMRDLQNEGFIVVQKRQKPKDPKESTAYYRKQHGYKDKKIHDHHNHNN